MLLPLRDDNPIRVTPYVTFILIGMNLLGFIMELQASSLEVQRKLIFSMGAIPIRFFYETRVPEFFLPSWMTLFTCLFLHAGWLHLFSNMLCLWIFGNNLEEYLGHGRFAIFYLLSGIIATFGHMLLYQSSQVPIIGASGAIAGILGGYLVLYPRHQVLCLLFLFFIIQIVRLPAIWVLGFWFLIQVFQGTLSLSGAESDNVAWFAHIGGFLAGLLVIRLARQFGWNALKSW